MYSIHEYISGGGTRQSKVFGLIFDKVIFINSRYLQLLPDKFGELGQSAGVAVFVIVPGYNFD